MGTGTRGGLVGGGTEGEVSGVGSRTLPGTETGVGGGWQHSPHGEQTVQAGPQAPAAGAQGQVQKGKCSSGTWATP